MKISSFFRAAIFHLAMKDLKPEICKEIVAEEVAVTLRQCATLPKKGWWNQVQYSHHHHHHHHHHNLHRYTLYIHHNC